MSSSPTTTKVGHAIEERRALRTIVAGLDAGSHQQTRAAILERAKETRPADMFLGGEVVRSTCRREARHDIKLGDELSDP